MLFSNNIKEICSGIEKFPDKGILEDFITDFTDRTDGLFGVLINVFMKCFPILCFAGDSSNSTSTYATLKAVFDQKNLQ